MGEPTPTLEQKAYQGLKEYIAISLYLWLVFSLFVLYRAVLIPQSFSDLEQQSPENAAVFCMDEKTAIHALDRTQPALPMRPHQPERQTVEYVRHGTVTLFAAFGGAQWESGRTVRATSHQRRVRKFLG